MSGLFAGIAGIDTMERLAMGNSPVHRVHPMSKLIVTLVYIVTVVSFSPGDISGLIPFVFYPSVMLPFSGTPVRPVLVRTAAAIPFSLMAGLSNIFFDKSPVFAVGYFAVSAGLLSCISLIIKTGLTVSAVLILIATTLFTELVEQLIKLKVPKIMCLSLVMTYRYLSALAGEAGTMYISYTMRAPGQRGIKLMDMGSFAGLLVLRGFDRAERVYQAMKCRGFSGVYYGRNHGSPRAAGWLYAAVLSAAMVFFRFVNISRLLGGLVG